MSKNLKQRSRSVPLGLALLLGTSFAATNAFAQDDWIVESTDDADCLVWHVEAVNTPWGWQESAPVCVQWSHVSATNTKPPLALPQGLAPSY